MPSTDKVARGWIFSKCRFNYCKNEEVWMEKILSVLWLFV